MNIYINGRFFEYNLTGVVRYSIAVLEEIDNLLSDDKYKLFKVYLLLPPNISYINKYKNIKVKSVGIHNGAYWEQWDLVNYSKNGWIISLASTGPILKRKQLLIMHDAKVAKKWKTDAGFIQRYFLFFMGLILGKTLKKIITISQYAKTEIEQYFYINPSKIAVAYEGYEHILKINENKNTLDKYILNKKQYILAVGGGIAKNNILTAKAMQLINKKNIKLVLTGNIPENVLIKLKSYENVKLIGRVSDEDLVSLYRNAICLCFPSVAEGFGIPPVEAMALDCPVIVSDRDSLPEVCGKAALYCNPNDVNSLARQLNLIITDKNIEKQLIEEGKKNLKRFSWKKTAKIILNEMLKIVN